MRRVHAFLATIGLALATGLSAHPQFVYWAVEYDGPIDENDAEVATAVAMDRFGNVVLTGPMQNEDGGVDIATVKYSRNGMLKWVEVAGGSADESDESTDIATDSEGNVIVAGTVENIGTGRDIFVVKYTPSGVLAWSRSFQTNSSDSGLALAVDTSNNLYVTGSTGTLCTTIKYSPQGTLLWVRSYAAPFPSGLGAQGRDIAVNSTGIVIVGYASQGATGEDVLLLRYNFDGSLLYSRNHNGPWNQDGPAGLIEDFASAVTLDDAGNAYVAGAVTLGLYGPSQQPGSDYITLKYNLGGSLVWGRRYGHAEAQQPALDQAIAIGVDPTGNVIVTGNHGTIAYSSGGFVNYVRTTPASDLAVDAAGNAYVLSPDTGGASARVHVRKYNPSGTQLWVVQYDSSDDDMASHMVRTPDGEIAVAGTTFNGPTDDGGTDFDFLAFKVIEPPFIRIDVDHTYWPDFAIDIGVGNPESPLYHKLARDHEGDEFIGDTGLSQTYVGVADAPAFYLTPDESAVWFGKVQDTVVNNFGSVPLFCLVTSAAIYTSGNAPALPDLSTAYAYYPTRTTRHALVDIDHTYRGDLVVKVGRGSVGSPSYVRTVANRTGGGIDGMWCQIDLTVQAGLLPPTPFEPWFVTVQDQSPQDEGELVSYVINNNGDLFSSPCLPKPIVDLTTTVAGTPRILGDTNADCCVDDADLTAVILDYGASGGTNGQTDMNGDSLVDDADITIVILNFGLGC